MCPDCLDAPRPLEAEHCCDRCRAPFHSPWSLVDGLCPLCREDQTEFSVPGFDSAYSFGVYEGVLRRLIQLYKYERIHTLAKPLGRMLVTGLPLDQRFDCIVPVPLHWRRRWSRGFNQAELLARVVSARTALPVVHALKRETATSAQAGLSNAERRDNIRGAFVASKRRRPEVEGRHVLLIDDVLTTGATVAAAGRVLRKAGARRVTVLTVARADRRAAWSLIPRGTTTPAASIRWDENEETE